MKYVGGVNILEAAKHVVQDNENVIFLENVRVVRHKLVEVIINKIHYHKNRLEIFRISSEDYFMDFGSKYVVWHS